MTPEEPKDLSKEEILALAKDISVQIMKSTKSPIDARMVIARVNDLLMWAWLEEFSNYVGKKGGEKAIEIYKKTLERNHETNTQE